MNDHPGHRHLPSVNPDLPRAQVAGDLGDLVAYLCRDRIGEQCDLVSDTGPGRCEGAVTGIRGEDGFADAVCDHHTHSARERDVLVVALTRATALRAASR